LKAIWFIAYKTWWLPSFTLLHGRPKIILWKI